MPAATLNDTQIKRMSDKRKSCKNRVVEIL